MSSKCMGKILAKAKALGVDFTERDAGEMFRKIRETQQRHESALTSGQGRLFGEDEVMDAGELRRKLRGMSPEGRLREYGQLAYKEFVAEKKEQLRRHALQIKKNADVLERLRITDKPSHIGALNDITFGVEARRNAILSLDVSKMSDAIDHYLTAFGYKITHKDALNILKEIDAPGSTGDAAARKLADVWIAGREEARARKNAAGADIGKLKDWKMPQAWDAQRFKTAGLSTIEKAKLLSPLTSQAERISFYRKAKEAFIDDALTHINLNKYRDEVTGRILDGERLREAIGHAYETITTGGFNEPMNTSGHGSMAKRLGAHRELHFKDAESWYAMMQKYGEKDIFNLMVSTVKKDARDIAMLEAYGPSPDAGFRASLDFAMLLDKSEKGSWMAKNYFDELRGTNSIPVNSMAANVMLGVRQWLAATKLGGMLLSQLNDVGTYTIIARTDGLGMGRALRIALKTLNPALKEDQALARRHGIAVQSVINDVAMRFGETVRGSSWTSKFASATIRLSGGEWWTNGMKRGYQLLIGSHLHDAVASGKGHDAHGPEFTAMLDRYGIGAKEWAIIQKAQAVDLYGEHVITPTAVKLLGDTPEIRETALKVMEMMNEEADIAITSPGVKEAALVKAGTRPGTVGGELMRSTALFKTFSLSMMTKVLPRVFGAQGTTASRAALSAQFALSMIVLGGASYQLKEISKGKNPRDMTTPGFWVAAAQQSGGLGIFGDFAFSDVNRFGQDFVTTLAGPVGGLVGDTSKLVLGNIHQAAEGKDANFAAEAVRFGKGQIPALNQWYTRAVLDHILFNKAQEAVNPGYLSRMRRRAEKQNKGAFWWSPEDTLPKSAPDIGGALGDR